MGCPYQQHPEDSPKKGGPPRNGKNRRKSQRESVERGQTMAGENRRGTRWWRNAPAKETKVMNNKKNENGRKGNSVQWGGRPKSRKERNSKESQSQRFNKRPRKKTTVKGIKIVFGD